jgi:hypothetical protein
MPQHDDMLNEGPREAPEPETAEQRSNRLGMKGAGTGIAAGGLGLAKAGVLGKMFIWLFAWRGVADAWRIGGWIGIAVVAALVGAYVLYRKAHA